jgi:hypothetical protein
LDLNPEVTIEAMRDAESATPHRVLWLVAGGWWLVALSTPSGVTYKAIT